MARILPPRPNSGGVRLFVSGSPELGRGGDLKTPWLLAILILFALSSVSLLALHSPAQAGPTVTSASAKTAIPPAPQEKLDAGDRDELREHWDTPKYAQEEKIQMAGMGALLVVIATISYRRRQTLRRAYRHG